ncbi:hypothetical protein V8D89_008567 [Ganoderma adspersum]
MSLLQFPRPCGRGDAVELEAHPPLSIALLHPMTVLQARVVGMRTRLTPHPGLPCAARNFDSYEASGAIVLVISAFAAYYCQILRRTRNVGMKRKQKSDGIARKSGHELGRTGRFTFLSRNSRLGFSPRYQAIVRPNHQRVLSRGRPGYLRPLQIFQKPLGVRHSPNTAQEIHFPGRLLITTSFTRPLFTCSWLRTDDRPRPDCLSPTTFPEAVTRRCVALRTPTLFRCNRDLSPRTLLAEHAHGVEYIKRALGGALTEFVHSPIKTHRVQHLLSSSPAIAYSRWDRVTGSAGSNRSNMGVTRHCSLLAHTWGSPVKVTSQAGRSATSGGGLEEEELKNVTSLHTCSSPDPDFTFAAPANEAFRMIAENPGIGTRRWTPRGDGATGKPIAASDKVHGAALGMERPRSSGGGVFFRGPPCGQLPPCIRSQFQRLGESSAAMDSDYYRRSITRSTATPNMYSSKRSCVLVIAAAKTSVYNRSWAKFYICAPAIVLTVIREVPVANQFLIGLSPPGKNVRAMAHGHSRPSFYSARFGQISEEARSTRISTATSIGAWSPSGDFLWAGISRKPKDILVLLAKGISMGCMISHKRCFNCPAGTAPRRPDQSMVIMMLRNGGAVPIALKRTPGLAVGICIAVSTIAIVYQRQALALASGALPRPDIIIVIIVIPPAHDRAQDAAAEQRLGRSRSRRTTLPFASMQVRRALPTPYYLPTSDSESAQCVCAPATTQGQRFKLPQPGSQPSRTQEAVLWIRRCFGCSSDLSLAGSYIIHDMIRAPSRNLETSVDSVPSVRRNVPRRRARLCLPFLSESGASNRTQLVKAAAHA